MTGHPRLPPRPPRPAARVDLPALAPLPTAAERAADLIREHIFAGEFMPGTQLPETTLAQALQVSRNTVRDAFRMLMHEHLLSHEMHRGVTVRSLGADDVRDIYGLRRMFELSAVAEMARRGRGAVDTAGMRRAVSSGEQADRDGRWRDVGTENLRFHAEIVAVHHSPRTDHFFKRLATELRLGFLAVPDAAALHRPFLPRNRAILEFVAAGDYDRGREELQMYLDESEQQIAAAIAG